MLRNAVLVGTFLGVSASFPLIYGMHPAVFDALVSSATGRQHADLIDATSRDPLPTQRMATGPNGRRVAIAVDRSGHFYGAFKLNGRKVDALIDTGASALAINLSTARRIGLSLSSSDLVHSVTTANGQARATAVTIARVEVGRISLDGVEALVLEDKALGDALIGMSFLNRLKSYKVQDGSLLLEQ